MGRVDKARIVGSLLAAAASVAAASCWTADSGVRRAFAQTFHCDKTAEVTKVEGSRYEARGCDHVATFDCLRDAGVRYVQRRAP